jgi:hypothetical protein
MDHVLALLPDAFTALAPEVSCLASAITAIKRQLVPPFHLPLQGETRREAKLYLRPWVAFTRDSISSGRCGFLDKQAGALKKYIR